MIPAEHEALLQQPAIAQLTNQYRYYLEQELKQEITRVTDEDLIEHV